MARPTILNKKLVDLADSYIEVTEDKIPTAAGLSLFIGISRSTLYEWVKVKDNKLNVRLSDIFDDIQATQENKLINNGLSGDFNSTITKLMLTKHGYSDKVDTALTGSGGGAIEVDQHWEVEFINAPS